MPKVKYGISNCYYAKATIASNGSATYATPVALPGAVNLTLDAQGDTNEFFADNIVYYTSVSNAGYEGDLELALVPDSFKKDILGYLLDTNGVLIENAGAEPAHFALIFQVQTDTGSKRVVFYNCVASRPAVAAATKEESIEPQTETISMRITSVYLAAADKDIVHASCLDTNTTAYNSWNSSVYTATTLTT